MSLLFSLIFWKLILAPISLSTDYTEEISGRNVELYEPQTQFHCVASSLRNLCNLWIMRSVAGAPVQVVILFLMRHFYRSRGVAIARYVNRPDIVRKGIIAHALCPLNDDNALLV